MKKIIYTIVILLSLSGLVLYSRLNCNYPFVFYIDERNKDGSHGNFLVKDVIFFYFDYLHDDRSLADYISAYESLIGYLQTSIIIFIDKKFPHKAMLIDCYVKIRDEQNRIIPYKNIQYVGKSTYVKTLTQYPDEKALLKTKPCINCTNDTFHLYYTYSHKDFKNVENASIEVYLKISADGKEYEKLVTQKISRRTKQRFIMSREHIPKEFY